MKKCFLFAVLLGLSAVTAAAQVNGGIIEERLDSAVVIVSRAGALTPMAYTMTSREDLRGKNPSWSLPMAVSLAPSVVVTNENGTGLGNSAMTIRGVKGSQINVTLNGITLNDSESQEVFWVNIPSLTAIISTVQIQRGLGTSASGSGAFGASINMDTGFVTPDPFASADISYGSFNTGVATVSAGSGLLPSGFYGSIAWSEGATDGYIERGFVRSRSIFAVLGYLKGNNSFRFTYLMGRQRSGITWDGIDPETYKVNRRYNPAGEYLDGEGNICYYPNQTDNYIQQHFQLNHTMGFGDGFVWSNTFNYTDGYGFDEYYKQDKKYSSFNIPLAGRGDVINRKEMKNDYFVYSSNLRYKTGIFNATAGFNAALYHGRHFGSVVDLPSYPDFDKDSFNAGYAWYNNSGIKREISAFVRGEYLLNPHLNAYADLQIREIGLEMYGNDSDNAPVNYSALWPFFNPRAGITWTDCIHSKAFVSVAIGHREPGRSDIKENVKGEISPIKPEKMLDLEVGYEWRGDRLEASADVYLMEYRDMLLETGKLSDSGYAIKDNVPYGYRRGIELSASWKAASWIRLDGNMTLSRNIIKDYVSHVYVSGTANSVRDFEWGNTEMLMSPSLVGMVRTVARPWDRASLSLDWKYVGKQFIDNTMRKEMEIPAYNTANISFTQSFPLRFGTVMLTAYVNNLFNRLYYASGWRYEEIGATETEPSVYLGIYPQAPLNATLKVSLFY